MLLMLAIVGLAGCHAVDFYDSSLQQPVPPEMEPARELSMVSLPTYRVEPPDILMVEMLKMVPLPPYHIDIYDVLQVHAMNTLGTGLLISTYSQTQQQAMMTTFFIFFPAMLLSDFNFPIANMPPVVQWLTVVNPIRYFLAIIRSIFLKGVGIEVLWPQMLPLLLIGLSMLFLAVRRFHKTL